MKTVKSFVRTEGLLQNTTYFMCCHDGMFRVTVTVFQFAFLVGPGVGLDIVPPT